MSITVQYHKGYKEYSTILRVISGALGFRWEVNKLKYNPKEELYILVAVKELGLASIEEVSEVLEKMQHPIQRETIGLVLERWKARDVVVVDLATGVKRYKMAKIPAPFLSLKMEGVVKLRVGDTRKIMDEIEKENPQPSEAIQEPKGKIGNYKTVELRFQNIDPILGGTPVDGETQFKLHKDGSGQPVISPAQMRGWFRENKRLIGLNPNAHSYIAFAEAVPEGEVKLTVVKAPVVVQGRGVGIAQYESFERGTVFKTMMRIPLNGIGLKSIDDIKQLFDLCEVCPLRGLGANPRYVGGRIRLLEIKTI